MCSLKHPPPSGLLKHSGMSGLASNQNSNNVLVPVCIDALYTGYIPLPYNPATPIKRESTAGEGKHAERTVFHEVTIQQATRPVDRCAAHEADKDRIQLGVE